MLYVGLDVHYRTTTCCILAEDGRPVKTKTFKGPWKKTVAYLQSLKEELVVCFEASVGYGPLYEALTGFCKRVQVAHPGNLRLIFRSKRKNDRVDAQKIAKLLYLDEVPAVHVPDQDARAWRELIEFRRRSINKRTKVKNQLRCLLRAYALHVPSKLGLWTKKGLAWLDELELPTATAQVKRRMLLVEASWQMIRHDPATAAYFDRLVAGKKERRKIALVAVAHRMIRIMHAMLRTGEVYRPTEEPSPPEVDSQAATLPHDTEHPATQEGTN